MIGAQAFQGCNLVTLVIPASVTYIDYSAFVSCANLTKVYFMGTDIPIIQGSNFDGSITDTAYYIDGATNTEQLSVFTTQTSFPDEAAITSAAAIKEFIVSGVRYITTSSSTAKATAWVSGTAITIPSSIGPYNVTEM